MFVFCGLVCLLDLCLFFDDFVVSSLVYFGVWVFAWIWCVVVLVFVGFTVLDYGFVLCYFGLCRVYCCWLLLTICCIAGVFVYVLDVVVSVTFCVVCFWVLCFEFGLWVVCNCV